MKLVFMQMNEKKVGCGSSWLARDDKRLSKGCFEQTENGRQQLLSKTQVFKRRTKKKY